MRVTRAGTFFPSPSFPRRGDFPGGGTHDRMKEVERLRAEAERCLRFAQEAVARARETLIKRAAEYLERAAGLEGRMTQREQGHDQPPPQPSPQARQPAQQQQQIQPKQDDQ